MASEKSMREPVDGDPTKVTYEDFESWDEKVWRSKVSNLAYPADWEDNWPKPNRSIKYVRIVEIVGPHWLEDIKQDHMDEFIKYVNEGHEWILVDPYLVADTAGRWIVTGNYFHKFTYYFGLTAIGIMFFLPKWKWAYWPPTVGSLFTLMAYHYFKKDPISHYKVEQRKRFIGQFPMKSFYPQRPTVFRRLPNIRKRIFHRCVCILAWAYAYYTMKNPPTPCYCGWYTIENFKPDPALHDPYY